MALAKLGNPDAVGPVLSMLRKNADRDAFLRHAGVMALSKLADPARLLAEADKDPAVRMSVLLALRRLGRPEVAHFLSDGQPDLVLEAARAINDLPINEALPQLAALAALPAPALAQPPASGPSATTQPAVLPEPIRTAVLLRQSTRITGSARRMRPGPSRRSPGAGTCRNRSVPRRLKMLATWEQAAGPRPRLGALPAAARAGPCDRPRGARPGARPAARHRARLGEDRRPERRDRDRPPDQAAGNDRRPTGAPRPASAPRRSASWPAARTRRPPT